MSPRAIAVTAEASWIDGEMHRSVFIRGAGEFIPEPVALVDLVNRASRAATKADSIALIIAGADAVRLVGLPPALGPGKELEAAPEAARAAGWRVCDLGYWTTFWGERGRPTVHLCVPAYQGDYQPWLIDAEDLAATTARLARYAELTGAGFRLSAGMSGLASLRDGRRWHRSPYWRPDWSLLRVKGAKPGERPMSMGERDLAWDSPASLDGRFLHRYDANTAYLAAASAAYLAADQLRQNGATWDPTMAGYWLVTPPAWNHRQMPAPWHKQLPTESGRLFLSTPSMALLHELADAGECDAPTLHDSWTARGTRLLRPWAEQLRDALALHPDRDDPMHAALKGSFRDAIGLMAKHGSPSLYRPDWRHTIASECRVSLWRRLWTIGQTEGRWPAEIRTDAVAYPCCSRPACIRECEDPVTACPQGLKLGAGLGRFRILEAAA